MTAESRTPATAQDIKALAHPLRLRIIRLTAERALTNKQLADELGRDPGTVLHHVRVLVDGGFLVEQDPRTGHRGARERPYASTGKSWRLSLEEQPGRPQVASAVLTAVSEEVAAAGADAVLDWTRAYVRLRPERRAELESRLEVVFTDVMNHQDHDGEPLALFFLLHRQREPGAAGQRGGRAD